MPRPAAESIEQFERDLASLREQRAPDRTARRDAARTVLAGVRTAIGGRSGPLTVQGDFPDLAIFLDGNDRAAVSFKDDRGFVIQSLIRRANVDHVELQYNAFDRRFEDGVEGLVERACSLIMADEKALDDGIEDGDEVPELLRGLE